MNEAIRIWAVKLGPIIEVALTEEPYSIHVAMLAAAPHKVLRTR